MSITEAGKWIGVSRPTAYKMAAKGDLPLVEIGAVKRVSTRELAALLRLPMDGEDDGDHD